MLNGVSTTSPRKKSGASASSTARSKLGPVISGTFCGATTTLVTGAGRDGGGCRAPCSRYSMASSVDSVDCVKKGPIAAQPELSKVPTSSANPIPGVSLFT